MYVCFQMKYIHTCIRSRDSIPVLFQWARQPQNCPFTWEISTSIYYVVPWATQVRPPNGISIGSAVFRITHSCDQTTNRQTDNATCDICSNRPHLCSACDATRNSRRIWCRIPKRIMFVFLLRRSCRHDSAFVRMKTV